MTRILILFVLFYALIIIGVRLWQGPPKPRRALTEPFTWWPEGHVHESRKR
jgi:hypothetical protein